MSNKVSDNMSEILNYADLEFNFLESALDISNTEEFQNLSVTDMEAYNTQVIDKIDNLNKLTKELMIYILNKLSDKDLSDLDYIRCAMANLLAEIPLSALHGTEDEWVDISDIDEHTAATIGNECNFTFKEHKYSITIESIQRNIRCGSVFRFNNDNTTAHRADAISFEQEDGSRKLTDKSIRFINFPWEYKPGTVIPKSIEDQNTYVENITNYLDGFPLPHFMLDEVREANYEKMKQESGIETDSTTKENDAES